MKKYLLIVSVILVTALMIAPSVLAKPGKGAIKGTVVAVDPVAGTLTITTQKGESLVVGAPEGFDLTHFEVGQWVLVKGALLDDGTIAAVWVKQIGKGSGEDDDEAKPEGSKENGAYCAEGKQIKPHPLASKLSEHYSVGEEWVMDQFCDGYGMGAIMLALKTAEISGGDPAALLASRAEGRGWGQIWQELKLIGSEKEGHSPPGWLKRPAHAGGNK